ncbi:hypothetical protein CC85DRAFT_287773 [Cutaneotrichosporon oleaginosum]|uniref:GST N-terminal domain-containing protein n=1 Tax=Cutaneotrichosporon oleaginosum TaxID=879819 RepID=A0A0J0XGF6_9TREE|nr:uncharacterized protein CC85DRAFT_287773 [Cutaneotrichosporon oleaginosum]KLT40148.1 hypothetical protein CC85DRAFT_287773 [Cutaneotrichosporon oleaginosum]
MSKPTLYEFSGSAWCQVPKLAVEELGLQNVVEYKSVNLAEGANFNPEFLKVNPHGTVPTLVIEDGNTPKKYTDSTNATREILKLAPNAPKTNTHTDHELDKLIREVHSEEHDPNVLLLLAVNDEDRAAKAQGLPAAFLGGRQKALDQYAPAGGEFASFLQEKQKGNGALLSFYTGNPDEAVRQKMYADAAAQWKSAGNLIRGEITHILRKTPGSFLGGSDAPGEADFHLITWLARIITDAGGKPGSVSGEAFAALQQRIGSEPIDPVVAGYWDTWTQRPSFKKLGVH